MRSFLEASEALQQAALQNESMPAIWITVGIAYYRAGQYLEALNAINKAIDVDPLNSVAWFNLGVLASIRCPG